MILSRQEREQVLRELADPREALGMFQHLVQRWCADYRSTRAGIIDLTEKIEKTYGVGISSDTLRKYADGVDDDRDPKLSTVSAVLGVILSEA